MVRLAADPVVLRAPDDLPQGPVVDVALQNLSRGPSEASEGLEKPSNALPNLLMFTYFHSFIDVHYLFSIYNVIMFIMFHRLFISLIPYNVHLFSSS